MSVINKHVPAIHKLRTMASIAEVTQGPQKDNRGSARAIEGSLEATSCPVTHWLFLAHNKHLVYNKCHCPDLKIGEAKLSSRLGLAKVRVDGWQSQASLVIHPA